MEIKFIDVKGKFINRKYVGEVLSVYSLQTTDHGILEVGIYNCEDGLELDVEYDIELKLNGRIKRSSKGEMIKNHLYVQNFWPVQEVG